MKLKQSHSLLFIICYCLLYIFPSVTTGENPSNPISKSASKKIEARYLTGIILSSSFADINLGTKSEIDVKDSKGNTISCIITDTTTMYDEKGNPITLDKLTKGFSVKIKYIVTKSGFKEAQLIKILHQ